MIAAKSKSSPNAANASMPRIQHFAAPGKAATMFVPAGSGHNLGPADRRIRRGLTTQGRGRKPHYACSAQGGLTVAGSLEGITILDLSQHLASHMATLVLAEQGADVIKVEPPGGDPLRHVEPGYFIRNRSKRSVTLDLNNPEQRDTLLKLVERADVVVESFGRDHMTRLGLDYESHPPALSRASSTARSTATATTIHGVTVRSMTGWSRRGWACISTSPATTSIPKRMHRFTCTASFPATRPPSPSRSESWPRCACGCIPAPAQAVECALHDGMMLITPLMWMWADNPLPTFAARTQLRAPYRPWLYECADGKWLHRMQTAKGNVVAISKLLGIELPAGVTRDRLMANVEQRKWFEQSGDRRLQDQAARRMDQAAARNRRAGRSGAAHRGSVLRATGARQ